MMKFPTMRIYAYEWSVEKTGNKILGGNNIIFEVNSSSLREKKNNMNRLCTFNLSKYHHWLYLKVTAVIIIMKRTEYYIFSEQHRRKKKLTRKWRIFTYFVVFTLHHHWHAFKTDWFLLHRIHFGRLKFRITWQNVMRFIHVHKSCELIHGEQKCLFYCQQTL